uniref:Uncharacterized protein n=1 Tax=Rhizophora mucronata TaxID=61149 RepID=A0A2P2NDC6_RHIMU
MRNAFMSKKNFNLKFLPLKASLLITHTIS